jgi:YrbI family 3-deoxy-D-manno-octulosonate 8-phosphate phosphatase
MTLAQRCQPIELILSDVDGVLTDGSIVYDNQGIETKRFFVRDGLGIRLWQRAGGKFGLVTARSSHIVKVRAAELGIEIVRQGSEQKRTITDQIAAELGLPPQKVCYIGDDLPDLAAMQHVGLAVAVADACAEVREAAHYVTTSSGGRGAVRETIELILKVQRRWEDIVQKYRHPSAEGVTG